MGEEMAKAAAVVAVTVMARQLAVVEVLSLEAEDSAR